MPVHRAPIVGVDRGVDALDKLVKEAERGGETVVSVTTHLGDWVVVTAPRVELETR